MALAVVFLDIMIHDLYLARYLVGSEVVEVFANGVARIDWKIGQLGDVDTAVVVLTHLNGTFTTIDNCREAVYDYDQRIEVFGSHGMARSDNVPSHAGSVLTSEGTQGKPLTWTLLERYALSYRKERQAFRRYLAVKGPSPAGANDALAATRAALAAGESLRLGRPVLTAEVE